MPHTFPVHDDDPKPKPKPADPEAPPPDDEEDNDDTEPDPEEGEEGEDDEDDENGRGRDEVVPPKPARAKPTREPHVVAAHEAVKATRFAGRLTKDAKRPEQHTRAAERHEEASQRNHYAANMSPLPAHAAVFRAQAEVHLAHAALERHRAGHSVRTDADQPREANGEFASAGGVEGGDEGGGGNPTASEYAMMMARHRETRPRPINKLYGSKGPSPEQRAEHEARTRRWNAEYHRLSKLQKSALVEENRKADSAKRTDADDDNGEEVTRLDVGRLGKIERTQVGGIRVPARLARAGILEYRNADGSTRRELRLPAEVVRGDSVKSLSGAPVTDDHPRTQDGLLDPTTWKSFTIGHIEDVRVDGAGFIAGTLVVQDAKAVDLIEREERKDISPGYTCRLDRTPGVWQGQPYDAVQRNIQYNHVAILARGRGRHGADVGLRLDANGAEEISDNEEIIMKVIRIDGKEFEVGSDAHLEKIDEMHKAALAAERAASQKTIDEQAARLDAADKEHKRLAGELASAKDPKAMDELVNRRVALQVAARRVLGDEVKLDGKTDRELMVESVRTDSAYGDFTGEGKSYDYIRALFDVISERGVRTDGVTSIVRAVENAKRTDAVDEVTKAHNDNVQRNREAWRQPLTATKGA